MSTLHGLRAKKGAVLLRTEEDGTEIWLYQHRTLRVSPTHGGLPGQYSPFPSRKALYKATAGTDHRNTKWYAEAVRDRRQSTKSNHRSVLPGPQSTER